MRALGTIGLATLVALAAGAATASADPLSMTFVEARANVGSQVTDRALLEPPETATFKAQVDPGSGAITDGALSVPAVSAPITEPIETEATLVFEVGTISGSFAQPAGALTLSGLAKGKLIAAGSECSISTTPAVVELSTAGSSGGANPRQGEPFTAGLAGVGAIAGQWTDMSATPVGFADIVICALVDGSISGPGGVWLKAGVAPPLPQPPGDGPASPGSSSAPQSSSDTASPSPACVVPQLTGKTLARAKAALAAAGCKLGEVRRPKRAQGQGRRALVVRSSSPAAAAKPASGKVQVRLGPPAGK